jgi:hypothetical protein
MIVSMHALVLPSGKFTILQERNCETKREHGFFADVIIPRLLLNLLLQ